MSRAEHDAARQHGEAPYPVKGRREAFDITREPWPIEPVAEPRTQASLMVMPGGLGHAEGEFLTLRTSSEAQPRTELMRLFRRRSALEEVVVAPERLQFQDFGSSALSCDIHAGAEPLSVARNP